MKFTSRPIRIPESVKGDGDGNWKQDEENGKFESESLNQSPKRKW